jgi:hypothetical protein
MAGKTGVVWITNPIPGRLQGTAISLRNAVWLAMQFNATEGQNYMRSNAPWNDRTGNARQGLFGRAFKDGKGYTIVYYHTVSYGIFLERRWSGKYQIIAPTVEVMGPKVMSDFNHILAAGGMIG